MIKKFFLSKRFLIQNSKKSDCTSYFKSKIKFPYIFKRIRLSRYNPHRRGYEILVEIDYHKRLYKLFHIIKCSLIFIGLIYGILLLIHILWPQPVLPEIYFIA